VGTFRTFAQELTVPGGAVLPADAVTNVTVSPTHRRRGLLTRMMRTALEAAKERGDAVASLISAEYPIYGRYGFGPAAWTAEWEVDVARTGLDPRRSGQPEQRAQTAQTAQTAQRERAERTERAAQTERAGRPEAGGRVDFADDEEVLCIGPALHDRFRTQPHRQGAIDRPARWWHELTGRFVFPGKEPPSCFHAVYRDGAGEPQGWVSWTVDVKWEAKLPGNTAAVRNLTALTPDAERALWHFVLSMDWILHVRTGHRAPDDLLPLLLPDPRAARFATHADFLWLRPLDVPRMLEARSYPAEGSLVLELHDAAGLAGGRYRLDAGPSGATCKRTSESPELSLPVGELGTLYLGDESAVRLAALGRAEEHREGAAATADLLLRTSRRAWCPDIF
jgi:predicted acetyltransferase